MQAASATYPVQCSSLRKNGYVVLKGVPCKIVEMSTSKTGKHGHAKVHLVGLGIFTSKKLEDICPSTHNMDVPVVTRTDYTAVSLEGDFLSLMDEAGCMREDIKLPDNELGAEIKSVIDRNDQIIVTVMKAMGIEDIVGTKPSH